MGYKLRWEQLSHINFLTGNGLSILKLNIRNPRFFSWCSVEKIVRKWNQQRNFQSEKDENSGTYNEKRRLQEFNSDGYNEMKRKRKKEALFYRNSPKVLSKVRLAWHKGNKFESNQVDRSQYSSYGKWIAIHCSPEKQAMYCIILVRYTSSSNQWNHQRTLVH